MLVFRHPCLFCVLGGERGGRGEIGRGEGWYDGVSNEGMEPIRIGFIWKTKKGHTSFWFGSLEHSINDDKLMKTEDILIKMKQNSPLFFLLERSGLVLLRCFLVGFIVIVCVVVGCSLMECLVLGFCCIMTFF